MALTSVQNPDLECARLAALRSYAVLDTSPEPEFDEIVRLANAACGTPCSAITLVDTVRCWFKARTGIGASEMPRGTSFCGYAFASSGTFVVPDARQDERFNRLPLVTEGGLQFYAGASLISPTGHALGTLCVLDYQPRELTAEQLGVLRQLADQAMNLLEVHRTRSVRPASVVPSPGAKAVPAGSAGCVLIVDDDEMVRSFVKKLTAHLGYTVVEASHGGEALNQLEKHAGGIGVVLTDVNMPVMDGLALVRALKAMAAPPAIAVMSGRFDAALRTTLRTEGVTALLGKPFSLDELEITLRQAQAVAR